MNHERKEPTTLFAVVSFLVIIAVLIIMINMGCNTTLSVFFGCYCVCDHNSIVEYSME